MTPCISACYRHVALS